MKKNRQTAYQIAVFSKKLALSTLIGAGVLLASSMTIAQESRPIVINPIVAGPALPDFGVIAVTNKNTSGPMGIYRFGSCKHNIRVVAKNRGGKYRYGTYYKSSVYSPAIQAGQIRVQLEKLVNGVVKSSDARFFSGWNQNEVKKINFNSTDVGWFKKPGDYTMRVRIIPCAKGASTSNCNLFPEINSNNNQSSINISVSSACPNS